MTGEETFEFAAAVAGVSIGLAAVLLLAIVAVVGSWRLFRQVSDVSLAASRAALTVEELARRLAVPPAAVPAEGQKFEELRKQTESLLERQQRLHEMARGMLDTAAVEGGAAPLALNELEETVSRLDTTVGQMATSLANLIRLLERQQERR